ncbi:MAG: hypothetical protein ACR2RA_01820 [Geminicoccaceae bacterium]
MQNRNMFLYRRQGPKKRAKPGPSRKNRGSQKGLPNSARDLLPLIQPATKALAQMLAGRSGASGQLGHARAILAQTERLVADRAHNRLNPAEREEFFEQVARLKLTLADAESEAEVQATEEEAPVATPMPVNRERLKEMAMALTSSGGPTSYEDRHKSSADRPEEGPDQASPEAETQDDDAPAQETAPAEVSRPEDPNQLRLPRAGAERVAIQPGAIRSRANGRRRLVKPDATSTPAGAPSTPANTEAAAIPSPADGGDVESVAAAAPAAPLEAGRKLPKGWIIDDDGFVVPGPAA